MMDTMVDDARHDPEGARLLIRATLAGQPFRLAEDADDGARELAASFEHERADRRAVDTRDPETAATTAQLEAEARAGDARAAYRLARRRALAARVAEGCCHIHEVAQLIAEHYGRSQLWEADFAIEALRAAYGGDVRLRKESGFPIAALATYSDTWLLDHALLTRDDVNRWLREAGTGIEWPSATEARSARPPTKTSQKERFATIGEHIIEWLVEHDYDPLHLVKPKNGVAWPDRKKLMGDLKLKHWELTKIMAALRDSGRIIDAPEA